MSQLIASNYFIYLWITFDTPTTTFVVIYHLLGAATGSSRTIAQGLRGNGEWRFNRQRSDKPQTFQQQDPAAGAKDGRHSPTYA